ncbi:hypothetical protein MBLNU459_g4148t1 [Dothideomycetes sp. NU459]
MSNHASQGNLHPRQMSSAVNSITADTSAWRKDSIDKEMSYQPPYHGYQSGPSEISRNTPSLPAPGFDVSSCQIIPSNASPAASCDSFAVSDLSAQKASPLPAVANHAAESDGRARTHPLYSAKAESDGNYHCPFTTSECGHKPTKLKCNYEYDDASSLYRPYDRLTFFYSKYIDSHIKPFRCKHRHCNNNQFSSTACLLRHEREAHGLHGHGKKPFLCQFSDCERAMLDNGFPRNYNLLDHMKRVHGYRPDRSSAGASPASGKSARPANKVRKRKADAPQMVRQRSGTASSSRRPASVKKEVSAEDHKQKLEHQLQSRVGRLRQEIQHMNDPQEVVSHLQQATQEIAGLQPTRRSR